METSPFKTIRDIINHWWLILLAGILLIGLGVWVIASPLESYLSLSLAFAIIILGTGIFEILFSVVNHKSMDGWGWILAGGLFDVIIGSYLVYYPAITMGILPLIVGFWLLFRGIMSIGNAFEVRSYGFPDWGWLLLTGIVITLIAIIILVNPAFGVMNIIIWTGLAFIFAGLFRIYISLKFKKLKK